MKVTKCERKEHSKAEVTVEFDSNEYENAMERVYEKIRRNIDIPGYRRGKAPRSVIEGKYGKEVFYEDVLGELVPQGLDFALKDQNLVLVGQPSVLDFDFRDNKTVQITYRVAIYPEVTLGKYVGIKAFKPKVSISRQDVEAEIENVRLRNAALQDVERPAQDGDTANIDFEGFVDSEPLEGGKDEDYSLVLGSGTFIPGFEAQVIGMRAGEEKNINVTFPDNYSRELAGKEAVFHIKLNSVRETILPELNDEFARDVSECDTFAEYKESVRKELEQKAAEEADNEFMSAVVGKVIENMTADIPEEMIETRIDDTVQNYKANFASQGMEFDQYLEYMRMDMETFRDNLRPSVLLQIQTDLVFEAVAEAEDFEITDEEIDIEYSKICDEYKMDMEQVKEYIPDEAIKTQIKIEKARNLILDSAIPMYEEESAE